MHKLLVFGLVTILLASSILAIPASAADDIVAADFSKPSWSKNIDLLDYVRRHAEAIDGTPPPATWSSDLVVNYVNQRGVKLLYMGFGGVDFGEAKYQLPLQSLVERFNTTEGDEAITASTFLMLMAFNDTSKSKYPGSPDLGDNLWASFTIGSDISKEIKGVAPKIHSTVQTTPLSSSADGSEWTWGMSYRDLAAIWWKVGSDAKILPVAFCTYDELSFSYRLVYGADGSAKLYISYTIGAIRDLWTIGYLGFIPVVYRYNDTGSYRYNQKIGSQTAHDFLTTNKISMSIIMAQRTWVAGKQTLNKVNGGPVSDGVELSNGGVQTSTQSGAKVLDVSFAEKHGYTLGVPSGDKSYDAVTRTANVEFYTAGPVLKVQGSLLWYANALMAHMFPAKYAQQAKIWMNATKSDYLYITSYPTYGGYKVVNDPVITAYSPAPKVNSGGGVPIPIEGIVIGALVATAIIFGWRRKAKTLEAPNSSFKAK